MANVEGNAERESYFLSVTSIDYDFTTGTDIPPPESPRPSFVEPPTPGGGPLTSHPTTPDYLPAAYRSSSSEKENVEHAAMHSSDSYKADSFRMPGSPASAAQTSSPPQVKRQPSGVRKLLSLNNLRSSFSSSRTSLSVDKSQPHGVKRPSSPSISSSTDTSIQSRPPLRQKKSGGNWFKRKSSMLFVSNHDDTLDAVDENDRPDTRESKRRKALSPAPLLPEVSLLGGGTFTGGDLGWDDAAFKRV